MIRVLIVDDQPVVRSGLAMMLEGRADIAVVGQAGSGPAALQAMERLRPGVVLMDLRMPDGDGIAATRAITSGDHTAHVIGITTFDLDDEVFGAIEAGATSLLLKDFSPDELAEAVRITARGESVITPSVLRRVLTEFGRRRTGLRVDEPARSALTPRERDLIRGIAEGKSNREIAKDLSITPGSVKNAIARMLTKHGLATRSHLISWAFRNGYIA
ncbi:response regulator [Microbacterium album]|uniref:DNA-binding response regulator n=1 Tax=Microbacterium album TaxID=2053191 RepID=A0A917MNI2_9MICO|nr:response regulator transcription factor [Microbacterium album]GGH51264.1 DNA-binding response regulator [Microbacterium album]